MVAVVVAVARVVVVVLDRLRHQAVDAERGLRDHFHLFPISHVQHHPVVGGETAAAAARKRGSGAASCGGRRVPSGARAAAALSAPAAAQVDRRLRRWQVM